VLDCFADDAVVVDHEGRRFEGRDVIRGFYEWQFRVIPDGRCELRDIVSQPGSGMAETRFIGTLAQTGKTVEALGPEVATIAGNKIKDLRDYHRVTAA
jgi:hypothetical protein